MIVGGQAQLGCLNLDETLSQPHFITSVLQLQANRLLIHHRAFFSLPIFASHCLSVSVFAKSAEMTDIQQWRRMIQPTRTRTPAVEYDEADAFLSPTTPRKALKPKFSSYFTQHTNNPGPSKKECSSPPLNRPSDIDWPSWPADDPYPSPDADVLIDSVMCRILGSPYNGLDPRFNGVLLQIFEGFRVLADEKHRLLARSEQDLDRLSETEKIMQKSARQWNYEKQIYKSEIKRLELLLAKGKRGLAEVTLARQDSLLRQHDERDAKARKHDTLDTIFQFMEKNKRVEDKVWGYQRGEDPYVFHILWAT